jgi:acyl dehydratase
MATNAEKALEVLKKHFGQEEGVSEWLLIDQDRINAFAKVTIDDQYIHTDPEKAAKSSPYKTTIAHGFLTLSMLTYLISSIPPVDPEGEKKIATRINYGFDKIRFVNPVKVNARIRARRKLISAELKDPNSMQLRQELTVEIEGESKPALIVDWSRRIIYT